MKKKAFGIVLLVLAASGTGTISFYQTHKEVHVSRHYQSLLKENLRNMR